MAKALSEFKYMTFDVVGTLIDFEGGITTCLAGIAAEAGVAIDGVGGIGLTTVGMTDAATLHPGDTIAFAVRVENGPFDRDAYHFTFTDLDDRGLVRDVVTQEHVERLGEPFAIDFVACGGVEI